MGSPRKQMRKALTIEDWDAVVDLAGQDKRLLKVAHGSQCNKAIHIAAVRASKEVVKVLLQLGANANDLRASDGSAPLNLACADGRRRSVVRLLLEYGADINHIPWGGEAPITPLMCAATCGSCSTMSELVKAGADVNFVLENVTHCTNALTQAVTLNQLKAVKWLVKAGADVNYREGYSALSQALFSGHTKIFEYLLAHGADPNITLGSTDTSLLSDAVIEGDVTSVGLLLSHGASPNVSDADGRSPLHEVFRLGQGQEAVAKLLVLHGADIHAKDSMDRSPLEMARGIPSVRDALLEACITRILQSKSSKT